MTKPFTKAKVAIAVIAIVAVLLVIALFALPVASELSRISKVRDQYRLDDAVHSEVIDDPVHKPTAEYVFDPPFMERYGLSSKDYLDAKGYFSPSGIHWAKWSWRRRPRLF